MGILQARILEWVAISSSRDLPNPGIVPASLKSPVLAGGFLPTSATWEAQGYLLRAVCVCLSLSHVRLFVTPWTVGC